MGVSKPGSQPKFAFGRSGGTRFNFRVSWGDGFGLYSGGSGDMHAFEFL